MNKAELLGQKFLDNHGYEHIVTKILGEGGQGMVCLTDTPGYVLKFVSDENGNLDNNIMVEITNPNFLSSTILHSHKE